MREVGVGASSGRELRVDGRALLDPALRLRDLALRRALHVLGRGDLRLRLRDGRKGGERVGVRGVHLRLGDCLVLAQRLRPRQIDVGAIGFGLGAGQRGTCGLDLRAGTGDGRRRPRELSLRGREAALGRGRHDADLRVRRAGLCLRRCELGLGLLLPGGQIGGIDLDERVALLDLLVVGHVDLEHRASDARGHGDHVGVDLRVVGRLSPSRHPGHEKSGADAYRDDRPQDQVGLALALCGGGGGRRLSSGRRDALLGYRSAAGHRHRMLHDPGLRLTAPLLSKGEPRFTWRVTLAHGSRCGHRSAAYRRGREA